MCGSGLSNSENARLTGSVKDAHWISADATPLAVGRHSGVRFARDMVPDVMIADTMPVSVAVARREQRLFSIVFVGSALPMAGRPNASRILRWP